jgi:hypothetical protein
MIGVPSEGNAETRQGETSARQSTGRHHTRTPDARSPLDEFGIIWDIYGRLPLVKRFLTVFTFISPSAPVPPKKGFRRWLVAKNQWPADIEPEHSMKLHAPSLVSCPHNGFSSVGRITRYCAPSENPLCKQYPARSLNTSDLVDGADLKHALCKVDTDQFMLHVDADLT